MKDGFIKVAAATPEIRVADCDYNADRIIETARVADAAGVKLCVFPELCVTGYTCGDLFNQRTLIEGAGRALKKIADSVAEMGIIIVVGCPMVRRMKLYNCAVIIGREILGVVPKKYLPSYNEFYEKRHFVRYVPDSPDGYEGYDFIKLDDYNERLIFSNELIFKCRGVEDFCFGVELCEDLWAVTPPSEALAKAGATIICNLSASNEMIGKADYRRSLVAGQSGRLIGGYIYASAGDGESTTDMVFSGHNIIAENGGILAESELFDNGLLITELDVMKLADERRRNTSFEYESGNGFITIDFETSVDDVKLTRKISRTPFIPSDKTDRQRRCNEILLMQSNGLKKRLAHTNAKTAVIGISGGLDSCLALLVAVRAMDLLERPRTDVVAVTMPCFGTTSRTKSNAEKLCAELGVTLRTIDITAAVKQHFADIGHDIDNHNVVFENVQARERTQVIMDIANASGGIVIGTGDLSEVALGWSTYNGDHMSMYGVNASVPKTLIRHIIGFYSETVNNPALSAVLADILDTPVSPELLPADNDSIVQKTEDIVGPYELHDFFLYYAIRWGFTPTKVYRMAKRAFEGEYSDADIIKWLRLFYRRFFSQQFKRSCIPDSAKIGSVSLSPRADWRMPSDACAELWLGELDKI